MAKGPDSIRALCHIPLTPRKKCGGWGSGAGRFRRRWLAVSGARGLFRLNLQRRGACLIDGERLNSRSIYRSAQLYGMLFHSQTPLLGSASPRCGNRRSHSPPNNKPEASGFGVERRNKRSGTNVSRHSLSAVPADAVERSLFRRGAGGGDRTRTRLRGILSPLCLPIPPHRRVPMLSPAARRVKPRESS